MYNRTSSERGYFSKNIFRKRERFVGIAPTNTNNLMLEGGFSALLVYRLKKFKAIFTTNLIVFIIVYFLVFRCFPSSLVESQYYLVVILRLILNHIVF